MSWFRRLTIAVTVGGASLLAGGALLHAAGVRVNTTPSIPPGVYRLSGEPVGRGAYVIFCPPQQEVFVVARERGYIGAGFCPGGAGQMMKKVMAAGGDRIAIGADGVRVNGALVPLSIPLAADRTGRPLPTYRLAEVSLGASELLLMSDVTPLSFDARYFGPIQRSQLRGVLRLLWTW